MKRIITTLGILFLFLFTALSQNPHPFELGFNVGAAWQKSDVKTGKIGAGAGLTFGQTYCMNQTSPLLWGWRFRYLNANTYGQDTKKSYGIANNTVLNGTDTTLDYYNNGGFVYHNYKTHIDELSIELLLGSNRIRERTNLYPYIFGGAGLIKATARINQLDGNNQRYNYAALDSAGTAGISGINGMSDGTYESLADGNLNPKWKFMPSFGVGLGYEVIKGFSIGLEHKMTWAFNDVLDGQRWSANNSSTGNNDMYHYTSFFLKFSFGRGAKHTSAATQTPQDHGTNSTTLTPAAVLPVITLSNPASSPFTTSSPSFTLAGKISGINSVSDMSVSVNGKLIKGFAYNVSTQMFSLPLNLQGGSNSVFVTATNSAGSINASATIIYAQEEAPKENPPVVYISSPSQSPAAVFQAGANVTGTILNISSGQQMQVAVNGAPAPNFVFNSSAHTFSANVNLIPGANTVIVSAMNTAGNDSKAVTIIFNSSQPPAVKAPVVTITNPVGNPYTSATSPVTVTAGILNITAIGQIEVFINGGPVPSSKLSYNTASHQLSFSAQLLQGANTVEVSATNVGGRDSKSATIIYNPPAAAPPQVTIINPASNPFNTVIGSALVSAGISNISSASQVSATLNGAPVPSSSLNYNQGSHQLSFNVNLIQGANTIVVSATNAGGSDSKTQTIIYAPAAQATPPVVTISNPASDPYTTLSASVPVSATVMNVNTTGQITVTLNGTAVSAGALSFNPASHQLNFNINPVLGTNTLVITATNAGGTASETQTIILSRPSTIAAPVVTITNPSVNPLNTTTASATITANITNVLSAGQISVSHNGSGLPAGSLNFNAASHQLTFNVSLVQGANSITISAVNAGGNDSKSTLLVYTPPVVVPAPVITITTPNTNPLNVNSASAVVAATVLNVNSSSEITVKINGTPTTAFSFNNTTKQLNLNANLVGGINTIIISAVNQGGSDSKTQTINYTIPVPLPVVTYLTPASGSATVTANTYAVSVKVTNIIASNQVTVKVNGTVITNFLFLAAAGKVGFTANLIPGNNTIVVSATNASGSDSEPATIIYKQGVISTNPIGPDTIAAPGTPGANGSRPVQSNQLGGVTPSGPAVNAPQLVLITPAAYTASTSDAVYTLTMKTVNVLNQASITVKVNGSAFTGFSWNNKTKVLTIPASLNMGSNSIVIEMVTGGTSKTETFTITRQ
ncbi:MAG TPA: hypothetical protein VF868_01235 [Bacteroidia bacterium]|jgi:hypothetical protein